MFGLLSGNLLTAVRGDDIKFGSFDVTRADLGNPYLQLPDGTVNCHVNKEKSSKKG